jgi:hypothetical protein
MEESPQLIGFLFYCSYFTIVMLSDWIKKHKLLDVMTEAFLSGSVFVAMLIFLGQVLNSSQVANARVTNEGAHSINMVFLCLAYFVFTFYPKINALRGTLLVMYLITIHESMWNVFFYCVVKPHLAYTFVTYGSMVVSAFVFTLVMSLFKYRKLIIVPTLAALTSGIMYGIIWVSIGFPITVSTYEFPVLTMWFSNLRVNMIEIGLLLQFVSVFLTAYILVNKK